MMTRCYLPVMFLVGCLSWSGCAESASDVATQSIESEKNQKQADNADKVIPDDPAKPSDDDKTQTQSTQEQVIEPTHGQLGPGQDAVLVPPPDAEPFVRPRRRMQIAQLDVAIRRASGGIGWTEGSGKNEKNLFVQLKATLGVPDYIQVLQADLTPGAVFQKFLGDAARSVCTKLVAKDLDQPPGKRVLMTHVTPEDTMVNAPEAVEKNLNYLVLRYHGYKPAPDDGELASWRWLFESVSHVADDPSAGWRAVCVSLMTHPNFYSY